MNNHDYAKSSKTFHNIYIGSVFTKSLVQIKHGSFSDIFYDYVRFQNQYYKIMNERIGQVKEEDRDKFKIYIIPFKSLQNILNLKTPKTKPKSIDEIVIGYNIMADNIFKCLKYFGQDSKHLCPEILMPYLYKDEYEAKQWNYETNFRCVRLPIVNVNMILSEW